MKILGRTDRVDLPGLGIENIHAKVDTGAWTSSLHCSRATIVGKKLEFVLFDETHPEFTGMTFSVGKYSQRDIKNSFGIAEKRFVIKTKLRIYNKTILAEFSLSDRDSLKYPVLLGRKILANRFLVDVTEKDLSYKSKITGK